MDSDQMQQAQKAAEHATQHGGYLSEVFAAVGAGVAAFVAAARLRRKPVAEFDDDHPLIEVIRDEGRANRAELHAHRELLHSISRDVAVTNALLKDRRS